MADRRAIQRRFDLMFPNLFLQGSAKAKGDDLLYNRLVERGRQDVEECLSANKPIEESTLEELDNFIGVTHYNFGAKTSDFARLERDENGKIVVYPHHQVKLIMDESKEEIMRTFVEEAL